MKFLATTFLVGLFVSWISVDLPQTAGTFASASPPPSLNSRCFMSPRFGYPVENHLYLIGTSTGRTVRTGPGDVVVHPRNGETMRNPGATIRGDEIAVERLARNRPAGVPARTSKIVVVRWGYGGGCELMRPYNPPLIPGLRTVYEGVLRPREFWANRNTPTVDVFPYTLSTLALGEAPEFFATLDSLPGDSAIRADPRAALEVLSRWSNARRIESISPGTSALPNSVLHAAQNQLAREIRPEISGTYRLSITRAFPADTIHTYLRIANTPSALGPRAIASAIPVSTMNRFHGTTLRIAAVTAPAQQQLFGESGAARDRTVEGVVTTTTEPQMGDNGSHIWTVKLTLYANIGTAVPVDPKDPFIALRLIDSDSLNQLRFRRVQVNTHFIGADSVLFEVRADGSATVRPARATVVELSRSEQYQGSLSGERVSLKGFAGPQRSW